MSAMPTRAPLRTSPEPMRSARTWHQESWARGAAALGRLRIVRAPEHARARVPFVVLCVSVLAASLLGALLLNTAMAQTSFVLQEQQVRLARLSERQQELGQEVEVAASPQVLAQRAGAAGMVPAPPPAFLSLADGAIIGEPVPAAAQ